MPATTAPGAPKAGTALLATLAMAQFMVVLDFTIVNVALPSIQHGLHVATTTVQWLVSAYAVTFGGFLLLGGRLADVFGRARLYRIGLCIFVLASISRRPGGRTEAVDRIESRPGARRLAARSGWAFSARHELAGRGSAKPRARCVRGGCLGRLCRWRRDRRPARRGELAARLLRQRPGGRGAVRGVLAPAARGRRASRPAGSTSPERLQRPLAWPWSCSASRRASDTLQPTQPAVAVGAGLVLLMAFVVRERKAAAPCSTLTC